MKLNKIGYSLKDVAIVQAPISNELHRGDVDPYINVCNRDVLPIFVAPMATVTDENNYDVWINNRVTPVIPRSVMNNLSIDERLNLAKKTFVSFSLSETEAIFSDTLVVDVTEDSPLYICIDIAHGTLASLYDICKRIKTQYGCSVIIMTGNIANPKAYTKYCECGIDYVRVGIGSGSRCTSSVNGAIHYPIASLLADLWMERNNVKAFNKIATKNGGTLLHETKIIADGGIAWFDDINTALALGADAVMIGKGFAECEEACGEIYWATSVESFMHGRYFSNEERQRWINNYDSYGEFYINDNDDNPMTLKPFREYYGMSTRRAQLQTGGCGTKTSEGISRPVEVKYPVKKWLNNVESYLRSAMTYTNSHTISDLNTAECIILGGNTYQTYMK
jgi:IMP dehydrogenase/GMP reductase